MDKGRPPPPCACGVTALARARARGARAARRTAWCREKAKKKQFLADEKGGGEGRGNKQVKGEM